MALNWEDVRMEDESKWGLMGVGRIPMNEVLRCVLCRGFL